MTDLLARIDGLEPSTMGREPIAHTLELYPLLYYSTLQKLWGLVDVANHL